MAHGTMPRPSEDARERFASLLPDGPGVTTRPMFGQVSAFVNGNMFMGLFGEDLFLRLPEDDRAAILAAGGEAFAPMKGRPMKEYVTLPADWDAGRVRRWVARSLEWTASLPPKAAKGKKR